MKSLYQDLPAVEAGGQRVAGRLGFGLFILLAATLGACAGLFLVYSTDMPQISELEQYRPAAVTELYDVKGRVIGSFALQRRVIATYDDFPPVLRNAVLSIEDKEFESHWGIDFTRVVGAAVRDLRSGSRAQGGSTLTMQLARNLFLSSERSFGRKFQEVALTLQIERRFTKEQIFTMYANQIYLGHGVYGFEAGAEYYFNKRAKDLTLEEAATLASLPKAPNEYSPINNPKNALRRRNLVINSMLEDGKITADQASAAKAKPIVLDVQPATNSLAPYFSEDIRQYLEKKYGSEEVHQQGLRVYTTLDLDLQAAATRSLLDGLATYERRRGWKGHLYNVLDDGVALAAYRHPDWAEPIEIGSYVHALVTDTDVDSATLRFGRYEAHLSPADIKWTGKRSPADILQLGDIAYVHVLALPNGGKPAQITLEQDSGAQAALLALDNNTGDIKAMIGGRDFDISKFNRATQALRQVGSSFKPYVYTAALDTGAVDVDDNILDAPTTFMTASGPYRPSNYDSKFWGSIPLRKAFANSRNIPALKIAQQVGVDEVIKYARRFGITSPLPPVLPLALGAAEITLQEQTAAFTTFPNDGVRVSPRSIVKVTDYDGRVLEEDFPEVKDVIPVKTARTMTTLLQGVIQFGTSTPARALKHPLGGKTGTTNDFTDAWFVGFSPSITCGVWVGYDEKKTLGPKETGGETALPIWMGFMKVAIQGHEQEQFPSGDPDALPAINPNVPPQATAKAQRAQVGGGSPVPSAAKNDR